MRATEIRGVKLKTLNEGTELDLPIADADLATIINQLRDLPVNNAEQTQAILYGRAMAKLRISPNSQQLAELCDAVISNEKAGQSLPKTFHQDLRVCLENMDNDK